MSVHWSLAHASYFLEHLSLKLISLEKILCQATNETLNFKIWKGLGDINAYHSKKNLKSPLNDEDLVVDVKGLRCK